MATYIYETIPQKEGDKVERYEIQQSMRDKALTHHPVTGQPIRRLIVGGYGISSSGKAKVNSSSMGSSGCCRGHHCGCH